MGPLCEGTSSTYLLTILQTRATPRVSESLSIETISIPLDHYAKATSPAVWKECHPSCRSNLLSRPFPWSQAQVTGPTEGSVADQLYMPGLGWDGIRRLKNIPKRRNGSPRLTSSVWAQDSTLESCCTAIPGTQRRLRKLQEDSSKRVLEG